MKRFSELNIDIQIDRKIFECKQVSINEIVNCEIEVVEFLSDIKTKHGDGRYLVKFKHDEVEGKFFTNSTNIKKTLDAVICSDFPFLTTIKCIKVGANSIYKFT